MGTVACVYAVGLSDYALREELPGGTTAFRSVVEKVRKLPELEGAFLLTDRSLEDFTGKWPDELGPVVTEGYGTAAQVFKTLQAQSGDREQLFFLWGDTPLVDLDLSEKMYRRHVKYYASYTFADGFPLGLSPEILRVEVLPQLRQLAERHEVALDRGMIFGLIQKDINAFDLETEIAPKDQRLLRLLLAADTRRNYLLLCSLMEKGGENAETVMEVAENQAEVLRSLPAYLQVQINEACPHSCLFCPYPQFAVEGKPADLTSLKGEMELEVWKSLLADAHAYCDDLVIGIGLWGEPALHKQIAGFVKEVLTYPAFRLLIETSGAGWKNEALKAIAELDTERIDWIVSLDAAGEQTYRRLRGEQWEEVQAAVAMMRELFGDGKVHVQAVRMKENEEELEQFYRRWKNEGIPLIIQKYDHFCGFLPDRKVTDLSPLTRFPCRHLKRDLAVLMDGSVRMCREDLKGGYPVGNIFEEGIQAVWEKMAPYYHRHIKEEFPSLCENCDEYYTFNF